MIRYLTAGESHGPGYTVIIDGFPAGFEIPLDDIHFYLQKRQWSLGRGHRSDLEKNKFHDGWTNTNAELSFTYWLNCEKSTSSICLISNPG